MKELTFEEMLMINGGRRGDHGAEGRDEPGSGTRGGGHSHRDRDRDSERFSNLIKGAGKFVGAVGVATNNRAVTAAGGAINKLGDYARDPHTVGGGNYDSGGNL